MPENVKMAILENEGLIYKIASYFNAYYNIQDLYQAGCMGIIKGYSNYNPSMNTKFSTYIYSYILGEMKKLVSEDKLFKVSRDITRLRNKILEASDVLAQKLMRNPTNAELCEFLNISEKCLAEALNSNLCVESIDNNYGDTNMLMHEVISSPLVSYDDLLYLKMEIESLDEPERTIMIKRYYEDMTQDDVSKSLGINQAYVSRKEKKVLSKIRTCN